MAAPRNRLVGIGAINGDSTIDDSSVIKLKRKGKFKETDGSNTSLLGVGAINGNNIIKENSFNKLTTIGADGEQNDVIIERNKKIDHLKRKTSGSNNKLSGIGAINGNNTIEKGSFDQLTTIGTVEQKDVIKERREMDQLKKEMKDSNKRFGIGEIDGKNTVRASSFKKLKSIPRE